MRALQTRYHHPLFRPGDLSEKSTREPRRPRQESHGVPVFANPEANDRLDSWKEIASHLKRTVRTVQRWERHEGLPVHRHLHQRANSVYARMSELDEWWNHEPHSREIEPPQIPSEGSRRQVTSPQVSMPSSPPDGEFADGGVSVNLNVQAFLTFERVAGCNAFEVSVLLQADEQFIGKTSLGTVAGGKKSYCPRVGTSRDNVSWAALSQPEPSQSCPSSHLHRLGRPTLLFPRSSRWLRTSR